MTWAARLVERHFDGLHYLGGEVATIQRWLSALPVALVRSRPRLLLAQALMAANSAHPEDVEPRLDAAERTAAMPSLVEPLTSRELEVLGLLAAGKSDQAIAGQLVITLDTAKKHVSHLLAKLGAVNRTEAVTRARQLGLIP